MYVLSGELNVSILHRQMCVCANQCNGFFSICLFVAIFQNRDCSEKKNLFWHSVVFSTAAAATTTTKKILFSTSVNYYKVKIVNVNQNFKSDFFSPVFDRHKKNAYNRH